MGRTFVLPIERTKAIQQPQVLFPQLFQVVPQLPQLLPQPQKRMIRIMMIHKQLLPPQLLLHPINDTS